MALTQAQKDFIAKIGALAAADMKGSGVLASLTMAQAVLESGWGTSALAVNANALFGIKADSRWSGRVYSTATKECYDGVNLTTVDALFRAYDNWEHSLSDHSAFLVGSSRYAAVIGERDYKTACTAIHSAGYATDPGYTGKLISIIETYGLADFDAVNRKEEQGMNLKTLLFTKNACYISGKKHTVKGILVHSTGANNPNLKRYIGPDDGLLGVNTNNNHWNQSTPDGRQVCVHGFIGKLADGSIATYQTLPWDMVGWHSGAGDSATAAKNGFSGNNANYLGYIGFEICEDALTDKAYFDKVYDEAVGLCAYLCKAYGIKPESPYLICHSEGHKLGIASNHGDVMHWFPKFGKSMDTFRAAVKAAMADGGTRPTPETPTSPVTPSPNPSGNIAEGTLVELKSGTANYYPGSTPVPAWVINDYYHRVTQTASGGDPVVKGGKTCVLLGKKTLKKGGAEEAGVNTWADIDTLTVVGGASAPTPAFTAYTVKVTTDELNIRKGSGTDTAIVGAIKDRGVYTIVEETNGTGASKWGRLKSGAGWISLDFAEKR